MPPTPPPQPRRLLRFHEVKAITTFCRMTIFNWEREGKFPKRIHIGPNRVVWDSDEVYAWIDARKAERS